MKQVYLVVSNTFVLAYFDTKKEAIAYKNKQEEANTLKIVKAYLIEGEE